MPGPDGVAPIAKSGVGARIEVSSVVRSAAIQAAGIPVIRINVHGKAGNR
jgi:hypothetical protein